MHECSKVKNQNVTISVSSIDHKKKKMKQIETERLNAVRIFEQINFDFNTSLKGILKLAAHIYDTPVAFITLLDQDVQLFKLNYGLDVSVMPRNTSFCTHAIETPDVMVVPDAQVDERFFNSPLVANAPNIRFYAGAPLATQDGYNIGTICVMDIKPKQVSADQCLQLEHLSKQAMHLMELELAYKALRQQMKDIEDRNKALLDIAFIQSHEFRGPLSSIMGLMNIIKEEEKAKPNPYLTMMEEAVLKLDEKIHMVVKWTEVTHNTYLA